jgi:hypothetical protein
MDSAVHCSKVMFIAKAVCKEDLFMDNNVQCSNIDVTLRGYTHVQ